MTRDEAIEILAEVQKRCAEIIPVDAAYLYGSYARGDFNKYSDVDIMVVSSLSKEELRKYRWNLAEISSDISIDHDVTVSLASWPSEDFRPERDPYIRNVLRDGVTIPA